MSGSAISSATPALLFHCKFIQLARWQQPPISRPSGISKLSVHNADFTFRPVLIHVNGVDDAVRNARYFDSIIDHGELWN